MTIDKIINKLQTLRAQSPFGGDTCVYVCLLESGLEYQVIDDIQLDLSEGALVTIQVDPTIEL